MSLLIADVVPEGLVFAADRNLSSREGRTVDVAAKVVKHGERIAGYVGRAGVNGEPMDEWLRGYLEQHNSEPIGDACRGLAEELERASAHLSPDERGMIVHVGGFEGRP